MLTRLSRLILVLICVGLLVSGPIVAKVFAACTRTNDALVVLYDFSTGTGNTVYDISLVGTPMDLTISGNVAWLATENGVIMSGGRVGTAGSATKVINALQASGQSTFEIWLAPDNLTQNGPARMISIGADANSQNYVLGQVGDDVEVRLQHTGKDSDAKPRLTTTDNFLTTGLTQIVHTFDGSTERLYINGILHPTTVSASGNFSNWDLSDLFSVGNEASSDRPWNGTIRLVAVYDQALDAVEVQQNYIAGPTGDGNTPDPQAPVAIDQTITTLENTSIDVFLAAVDCETQSLTYSINSHPVNGTLDPGSPADDEHFVYTPDPDYTGPDSFSFTASDGGPSGSNIATVSINVTANHGPFEVIADYSETVDGVLIYWEKARYEDLNISGTALMKIPFGLALPDGYDPAQTTQYPLVLYLHGASVRGDNNEALKESTARYFARSARTNPDPYNAFVLSPQCAAFPNRWVQSSPGAGPYDQTDIPGDTYGEYMHLTENLLYYLTDRDNNAVLAEVLGFDADDIDLDRVYVVGESMGGQGTWDIVARQPGFFAGAIAAGANGPKNRLAELSQTPLWAIHGELDLTVPNFLPTEENPDGGGSLGMLALLDPGFDGINPTEIIYVDDPLFDFEDPPDTWQGYIYSEFVGEGHSPPASDWTTVLVSDASAWLFARTLPIGSCPGDVDQDFDTDGADLALYITNLYGIPLTDFARSFGNSGCP